MLHDLGSGTICRYVWVGPADTIVQSSGILLELGNVDFGRVRSIGSVGERTIYMLACTFLGIL